MNWVLSALVLSGGVALMAGVPCLVLAGAPIPEMDGAPMYSIAPVVSRLTPGVVGISVRGRVREDNPLLQDPLFRRFFNLQQQPRSSARPRLRARESSSMPRKAMC